MTTSTRLFASRRAPALALLCMLAAAIGCADGGTAAAPAAATSTTAMAPADDCQPGGPCSTPVEVRVVIVTMFEIGADEGDRAGEFQLWKERGNFTERYPLPHGHHDLWYDPERKILAMVTGMGTLKSAPNVMAVGLDQRFDLSNAYWLIAGIAGIDPEDASIGSAAWSAYLVDGDLGHEIDAREKPEDWPTGYFARRSQGPYVQPRPESEGEVFVTNIALRDWAFELTRDMTLPDLPGMAESRAEFVDHPNARRPPFVLRGGHLAAMTFWHGELLNEWANRWVEYWSNGESDFVTSAMEDTGSFQAIEYLDNIGRADRDRVLVLRAGSNYTIPPPGLSAAENLLLERKGYTGFEGSVESLHLVGSKVIDALLADWET
ncbi:MAG TPA: purine nucleoside permease, partial [Pseudomonadales bacterium]|nr:purine nucleoside permease [Pseudomonadales bacterium]